MYVPRLGAMIGITCGLAALGSAQYITNDRWLPPPAGVYEDQPLVSIPATYLGTDWMLLPGSRWTGFNNCILPPPTPTTIQTRTEMTGTFRDVSNPSFPVDSFFDVFIDIDVRVHPSDNQTPTETVPIEIVALSLTSVQPIPLPNPLQIRLDPVLPSGGLTQITNLGGGQFSVDSFFDVFTEISLDGGSSWNQADRPLHLRLQANPVPEPATMVLAGGALAAALRRRRRRV